MRMENGRQCSPGIIRRRAQRVPFAPAYAEGHSQTTCYVYNSTSASGATGRARPARTGKPPSTGSGIVCRVAMRARRVKAHIVNRRLSALFDVLQVGAARRHRGHQPGGAGGKAQAPAAHPGVVGEGRAAAAGSDDQGSAQHPDQHLRQQPGAHDRNPPPLRAAVRELPNSGLRISEASHLKASDARLVAGMPNRYG